MQLSDTLLLCLEECLNIFWDETYYSMWEQIEVMMECDGEDVRASGDSVWMVLEHVEIGCE